MITSHVAREQITVADSVKTLTAATVRTTATRGSQRVAYAEVDVQGADVRVTFDGSTDPVGATTGTLWLQGEKYRVWGITNLVNLKMIRDGSTSVTAVVDYWGNSAEGA